MFSALTENVDSMSKRLATLELQVEALVIQNNALETERKQLSERLGKHAVQIEALVIQNTSLQTYKQYLTKMLENQRLKTEDFVNENTQRLAKLEIKTSSDNLNGQVLVGYYKHTAIFLPKKIPEDFRGSICQYLWTKIGHCHNHFSDNHFVLKSITKISGITFFDLLYASFFNWCDEFGNIICKEHRGTQDIRHFDKKTLTTFLRFCDEAGIKLTLNGPSEYINGIAIRDIILQMS